MRIGNVLRWLATSTRRIVHQTWNEIPELAHQTLRTQGGRAFLIFVVVYVLTTFYCAHTFKRDPTSAFFDPRYGYERIYSLKRQEQAEVFIAAARSNHSVVKTTRTPKLCVGISTIGRPGKQYVSYTIGSLLEGLTEQERAEIHLVTFIAQTNPSLHPIYEEQWLEAVSDDVMLYNVSKETLGFLQGLERDRDYRVKGAHDYAYVLERCIESKAPYIAILDDDTLAVAGWYSRAMAAVERAEADTPQKQDPSWLYLRLFFTEEFLGWHSEQWHVYLRYSLAVFLGTGLALIALRSCGLQSLISDRILFVTCFVCVPACIGLYFLAGRLSLHPLKPGVYQMLRYGCCGQALLFPRDMALVVLARFQERGIGFPDTLVEELANEKDYVRWAVIPSLVQHIGSISSKGDDFGAMAKHAASVAEKIWSFGFEMYDASKG
jgi:hypothetical protein